MGRGSRSRETLLHQHRSLVECRELLPEEIRNGELDGIFEQDPLGSHKEEVGSASLVRVPPSDRKSVV